MNTIQFDYRGKTYGGRLYKSTQRQPLIYWVFLNIPEINQGKSEILVFKLEKGGDLEPAFSTPLNDTDLLTAVKAAIS